MIHHLNQDNIQTALKHEDLLGKKASSLYRLLSAGLDVPTGLVLDSELFLAELEASGLGPAIDDLLRETDESSVEAVADAIDGLWSDYRLSSDIAVELSLLLDPSRSYAVRSSAYLEDLEESSFAGQYDSVLGLSGITAICEGIKQCYRSLYSARSLSYLISRQGEVRASDLLMAVIIQEMVDAKASGVLFTAHPLLGEDRLMAAELAAGAGEALVGGQVKPVSVTLPWFDEIPQEAIDAVRELDLTPDTLMNLRSQSLEAARLFGFPLDIEFAIDRGGRVRLLQARAITGMRYDGIRGLWTTADFKDGGVSAEVCRRYMWSLYELAWEHSLKQFLRDGRLLSALPTGAYSRMFFGRPYWNLGIAKQAMKKVPGYKERSFDADYGIVGNYTGDGETTPINLLTILRFLPTAWSQRKLLKRREKTAPDLQEELLAHIESYHERLDAWEEAPDPDTLAKLWLDIHYEGYPRNEGSYFHQIFLNTIHQTLIRDSLLKQMSEADYLALLGGLDEVSHLLPFYELWQLSRKIREDNDLLAAWQTASTSDLTELLRIEAKPNELAGELQAWFLAYGYHSAKELDISEPNYSEAPEQILAQLQAMLDWDDSHSPEGDREAAGLAYDAAYGRLTEKLGARKAGRLEQKIGRMRSLLWWREEFRDVSTRYYDLIRRSARLLARELLNAGLLEDEAEIWQLKIDEIRAILQGELVGDLLRETIYRADCYYDAYRLFMSANEIPTQATLTTTKIQQEHDRSVIQGLPAGGGIARGPARVVRSLGEIDRIRSGDILITRFTDTGWTVKFAVLAGIVTEYGGVLSHAAIVSREYNIPCIVSATDAMERVTDGETIVLDAVSGRVWRAEDYDSLQREGGDL